MKQRGSALIISMMMIATIGAVAFGIAKLLFADTAISTIYENGAVAYYSAESGIEEGFLRYKYNMNAEVPYGDPLQSIFWSYGENPVKVFRTNLTEGTVDGGELLGDIDGDGEGTSSDLGILGLALGSSAGDSNWAPRADVDGDGEVTSADLSIGGLDLGKFNNSGGIPITNKVTDSLSQFYDLRMGYLGINPDLDGSGPFFYHDVNKDGKVDFTDIFSTDYSNGDYSFLRIPKDEARTFDLSNIDFSISNNSLNVGFKFIGVGASGYTTSKECQAMAEIKFSVNVGTALAREYKGLTSFNPGICSQAINTGIDAKKLDAADANFSTGGYRNPNDAFILPGYEDYYYSLNNILTNILAKAGATITKNDKVVMTIKPLYYAADVSFSTLNCDDYTTITCLELDSHQKIVTGPYTYMTSVGYYGNTTRTLTANIDRQSGTLYDLYGYVLFKGDAE